MGIKREDIDKGTVVVEVADRTVGRKSEREDLSRAA